MPNAPDSPETTRRAGVALRLLRGLLAVAVVLVATEGYFSGALTSQLFQLMLVLAPVAVAVRLLARRSVQWRLPLAPLAPEHRPHLPHSLVRSAFWSASAATVSVTIPEGALTPEEREAIPWLLYGAAGTLLLLEWLPRRPSYLLPTLLAGAGSLLLLRELHQIHAPSPPALRTELESPVRGEWMVFHGGRSGLVNHHWWIPGQAHALDLDASVDGPPPPERAQDLAAYPAFRQPLYAPVSGLVVAAVDSFPDNAIGQTDAQNLAGNHLVLEAAPDRYVLMAHLLQGSLRVRPGNRVRAGELVARCGNSGNTSEPHLHLQVQNLPDFGNPRLRTYPIVFRGLEHRRGGRLLPPGTEPRRNDRLRAPPAPAAHRAPEGPPAMPAGR